MIGGLPDGIGVAIMRTVLTLAAVSLTLLIVAVVCAVLAWRSGGRRAMVFWWLCVVFGLAGLAIPVFVVVAVR